MRHFAALYLAIRFFNLLLLSTSHNNLKASTVVFVITSILVARYQPYKHKKYNIVDVFLLLTLISVCLEEISSSDASMYPRLLQQIATFIVASIPPSYGMCLVIIKVLPTMSRCVKRKMVWTNLIVQSNCGNAENENEELLSDAGGVDYHSCQ